MASLTDIAPSAKEVKVRGSDIGVTGVSIAGVAYLLNRFPVLKRVISGKDIEFSPEALIAGVPEAAAAIIAAGTGHPGSPEHETAAAGLTVGEQVDLMEAILDATMPQGVAPFVEKVTRFLELVGNDIDGGTKGPDSSSPKP